MPMRRLIRTGIRPESCKQLFHGSPFLHAHTPMSWQLPALLHLVRKIATTPSPLRPLRAHHAATNCTTAHVPAQNCTIISSTVIHV